MPNISTIFVYGTLRRNSPNPMSQFLASQADWIDEASAPGQLYLLGSYPGMKPAETEDDWVLGDLYDLREADITLPHLDEYEGCAPPEALYKRVVLEVMTSSGQRCPAWVYLYEKPVHEDQRIWSGDYFRERSKKS